MIPTGISPTEAAFEVIGLVNAKSIMDFLFLDTKIGVIAFLIGILTALWESVKEADFSVLWSYLILFCALTFIFIKPMASLEDASSTMEQAGWKETTTADSLKEAFADTGKTRAGSLGLVLISQGYNAVVFGTISAISKVTQQQDFNYMKNPFLVNKVSLYLGHFSAGGIRKDPALKRDLADFLNNDYPQVLGRMVHNNNAVETISTKWWPGDNAVIANYDPGQKARWDVLNSRLDDYIRQQINKLGLVGNFASYFLDYTAIKIKLLTRETEQAATDIASNVGGYGISRSATERGVLLRGVAGVFAFASSAIGQFFSTTLAESMIKALPYLEGYAVMIIYSLFPFTLLLCLLFRSVSILKEYFMYLFWVKSWVIVWALIHYASIFMATLQSRIASGATSSWFFEAPYFNTVTAVLLVMSPGIAWFMTKGVLSGIGEVASAMTIHADKGIGKIQSKMGV